MHICAIKVEILEGGTKRITISADFNRSEEIEPGDEVALMNHLRELGGEDTKKPEPAPKKSRGRPKKEEPEDEDDGEDEPAPKKTRSRGRPKKEEPEDEDDGEDEPAPRKRAPRKKSKAKASDDDEISDQDLVKACAKAMEELSETFDKSDAKDVINEVLDEFGVTSCGDIDAEQRQEFLDNLKEAVEYQLSDDEDDD